MKTNPLRMGAASPLLAMFIPQMATGAEAQFTDDNWVSGDVEVPLGCCGRNQDGRLDLFALHRGELWHTWRQE